MTEDQIFVDGMEASRPGEKYQANTKEVLNYWILHNSRISFKPPNNNNNNNNYGQQQVALKNKVQPRQYPGIPEIVNTEPPNYPEDINVIIRYLKADAFPIQANKNDKIIQLKDKLRLILNIPISQQKLVLNGVELDNFSTLQSLNIVNDTNLRLVKAIVTQSTVSVTQNNGQQQLVTINPGDSVRSIKQRYADSTGKNINDLILVHNGHTLSDNDTINDFQLGDNDEIHVIIQPKGQNLSITINPNLFSPSYHYKFPNSDSDTFFRGGEQYFRPVTYQRLALNVLGEYEEDKWLGSSNSPGEWIVAYHGSLYIDYNIVQRDNISCGNNRYQLGVGYYCSKHIETVEKYSSVYHSNQTNRNYRVIIQSRVRPDSLIQLNQNGQPCDLYLVENEICIRCYGICYKEV